MKAAKLAGLDVADVELEHIGNRDVLIVTRFDRRVHDGVLQRVHQEDGCQALGINPGQGNKYERASHRDNPSYGRFAELLLNFADDARHEQVKLAQAMVLHIASGNTDAHARNHGFLIEDGVVRCAPIYDASPTIDFSNTSRCALRVCGQELLEYVTYQHLHLEARSWLPLQNDAGAIIKDTAVRLHAAFVEAAAMIPQVPDEIVERMRNRAVRLAG
jgi:serine/threonine-protein kinase HipA